MERKSERKSAAVDDKQVNFDSLVPQKSVSEIMMAKKLSVKSKMKFNENGKRIIVNWCLYADYLARKKREEAKKPVKVSSITDKDRYLFSQALRKLVGQRKKSNISFNRNLVRLKSARSLPRVKSQKKLPADDNYVPCHIDYKNPNKNDEKVKIKKDKRSKSQSSGKFDRRNVKVSTPPPMKTKPWAPPGPPKRKPRPVVSMPFLARRAWNPCRSKVIPKFRPTIEYPPLTLRKT